MRIVLSDAIDIIPNSERWLNPDDLPNSENKPQVNHIRPVTKEESDNRVCNLEWVTSKENSQ